MRAGTDLLARLRHPQTTVRWRLTLLYGSLFLVCAAVLLAITYALVAHASITHGGPNFVVDTPQLDRLLGSHLVRHAQLAVSSKQRIADLHDMVIESGIALAMMSVLSGLLGWVVAGRVLAPLRTITAATRQISDTNLHERLAIGGPPDELKQLADTIDGLLQRLEAAFEAQRRFVANASHELRTPLSTMRVALDVALAKPEGAPPQVTALDATLRADLDQADRLLESFLVLARAQHGELGAHAAVSLAQIARDALAAHAEQIAAKQIEMHTALASAQVTGSKTLLQRMVENVIENAARHNQPHGFISLTLTLKGGNAQLVVESGGPILDQCVVAQLAQPFRRLGVDRTGSQNGHGLGLSIVAAVAVAHGGTLALDARPAGGLRVQITLPDATVARTAPVPA